MYDAQQILDMVNGWTGSRWTDPVSDKKVYIGPVFSQQYAAGTIDWLICIHVGYSKVGSDNRPAQITIRHPRGWAEDRVEVVSEPRRCPKTGNRLSPSDSLRASAKRLAERISIKISAHSDAEQKQEEE